METVGERVRRLRKGKGLTQQVLADRAGISYNHVWMIENERRPKVGSRVLSAIAQVLGVSADYLLGVEPETEEPRGDLALADSRAVYHARRLPAEVQAVAAQLVDLGEDVRGKLLDAFDLILDVASAAEAQAATEGAQLAELADQVAVIFASMTAERRQYWWDMLRADLAAVDPSTLPTGTTPDGPAATSETPQ